MKTMKEVNTMANDLKQAVINSDYFIGHSAITFALVEAISGIISSAVPEGIIIRISSYAAQALGVVKVFHWTVATEMVTNIELRNFIYSLEDHLATIINYK